jgi:spore germination protein GerM
MSGMANKKRKSASVGCLFWIALILLFVILIFLKRDAIMTNLKNTGVLDFFSGKKTEQTASPAPATTGKDTAPTAPAAKTDGGAPVPGSKPGDGSLEPDKPATEAKDATPTKPTQGAEPIATKPTDAPEAKPVESVKPEKPATPTAKPTTPAKTTPTSPTKTPAPAAKPTTPTATPAAKPQEKPAKTRTATLYFVRIDADGRVIRTEAKRDIARNDSPLTETLQALIAGPTNAETAKGLRSLIPAGTRILSTVVKDGVATINLSEEFQFNQYGIEGYLGQLSQIVFTATAFSTVKSVQFLIEGQRRDYLGAEGVWIGTPLAREKF